MTHEEARTGSGGACVVDGEALVQTAVADLDPRDPQRVSAHAQCVALARLQR